MKAELECLECVLRQSMRAGRLASDDPAVQRRIMDETARRIPSLNLQDSPAAVSLCAYEITSAISGNPDPYRDAKRQQNAEALRLEPELRAMLDASDDRLDTALHLAAAGNVIDLGTLEADRIDVRAAVADVMRERFAVDHGARFRESLARCDDLLFFLDNAGEIVFDKLLIEELQRHTRVTAVVKAAPILNDALMEDANATGVTEVCDVIDNGGAFIGSPLSLIPDGFRARMDAACMLVGKGQGNYETLDSHPGDVFLILKAKCEVVARHMGVRFGQVALISTRQRHAEQQEANA
jgi:hypothetical protein